MRAFLVFACILLAIPALLIGGVGGPTDRPFLIAGAILLGSATIAVALPGGGAGGRERA
ncbi:hypothetical protein [Paludisphaera sp.]|uniref:hypothetical protein n=1 Tax=Paludisphaera sp. TaxID=2017432 RepID=UPI00301CCB46